MRIRDGSFDPNNAVKAGRTPAAGAQSSNSAHPAGRWQGRVDAKTAIIKGCAAVGSVLAVLVAGDTRAAVAVGLVLAAVLGTYALRDLLIPVRVSADLAGITVARGFAGRRRLAWSDVERVRVDDRQRLGRRSRLLEIDTGAELYLFGRSDLGIPVEDAVGILRRLRGGPADGGPASRADRG